MTDRKLIKEIRGYDCEIFAVMHHQRKKIGEAIPTVKVFEDSTDVGVLGTGIRQRTFAFSIVFCNDIENFDSNIKDVSSFSLYMHLENKNKEIVPFGLYDVTLGDMSPYKWSFEVTDPEVVKLLLEL